jgi:hypothetical protein
MKLGAIEGVYILFCFEPMHPEFRTISISDQREMRRVDYGWCVTRGPVQVVEIADNGGSVSRTLQPTHVWYCLQG